MNIRLHVSLLLGIFINVYELFFFLKHDTLTTKIPTAKIRMTRWLGWHCAFPSPLQHGILIDPHYLVTSLLQGTSLVKLWCGRSFTKWMMSLYLSTCQCSILAIGWSGLTSVTWEKSHVPPNLKKLHSSTHLFIPSVSIMSVPTSLAGFLFICYYEECNGRSWRTPRWTQKYIKTPRWLGTELENMMGHLGYSRRWGLLSPLGSINN